MSWMKKADSGLEQRLQVIYDQLYNVWQEMKNDERLETSRNYIGDAFDLLDKGLTELEKEHRKLI